MAEQTFASTRLTQDEYTRQVEGPAVDAAGNLYVCNFRIPEKPEIGGAIGIVKAGEKKSTLFTTLPVIKNVKSRSAGIRFGRDGSMYVADFNNHNIFVIKPGKTKPEVHFTGAFNQPNDLAIAKDGTLYASDPAKKDAVPFGRVWRVARGADGKVRGDVMALESKRDMRAANGIDLSPDEKTLYVGEADTNIVWSYNIDGLKLTNEKKLHEFGKPKPVFDIDGMRTDADGLLYVTHNGGGRIVVLKPDGSVARTIATTGPNPSNLTFGGTDGKTVFVTMVKVAEKTGYVESFRTERPGREFG